MVSGKVDRVGVIAFGLVSSAVRSGAVLYFLMTSQTWGAVQSGGDGGKEEIWGKL